MRILGERSLTTFIKRALDFICGYLLVGLVISALFATVGLVAFPQKLPAVLPISFTVKERPFHTTVSANVVTNAVVEVDATKGTLVLRGAPRPLAAISWIYVLAVALGGLAILALIRDILASVADGEAFTNENALRMRKIGLIVVGIEALDFAGTFLAWLLLPHWLVPLGISIRVSPVASAKMIGIGLVIIILAEVFREGAVIKEEQGLTV
jgi:hypothetical protein